MPEKNQRKRIKTGIIIIILFLLLYIPSFIHWLSEDNITTDILRTGIIEDSVNAEGTIIRDEVLLNPPSAGGKLIPEISEGERIPAFFRVATVSDQASQDLLKELEDINAKIISAQNERAKKLDFFSEDMSKIDDSIGQRVQSIINECNINSMKNLEQLTFEVDKLIEKKASIAGEGSSDSYINSLKQQKKAIQLKINSNTSQVISQYSGIVSYTIDGYERTLTPEAVNQLTPAIINSIADGKIHSVSGYDEVKAGKPFIKVIKGNNTYIAAVLAPEKAALFKTGDIIKVRLNTIGALVKANVVNVSKRDDSGKCIVTVSIDRYSEELSSIRKINIDLVKNSYEGLKLPSKCLYSPDAGWKKAKVMLIKANCAVQREVEVLYKDDEYAVIKSPDNEMKETVSLYDIYILNPVNIKEGQIILK